MHKSLDLAYQDPLFIVVNKPSGLLAAPGKGLDKLDSVTERVRALFPEAPAYSAVHRLDMDTSGLMLLALSKEVHRALSIQFQEREVSKKYIALIDGIVEENEGKIELPFRLDVDNRPHQIYDEEHGKMGTTLWQVIERVDGVTRIQFTPITGRTHQLRIHSAHEKGLGLPIIGDPLYGTGTGPGKMKLHATMLEFTHPETDERLVINSEPNW
ncbi:MAG: RluA family pseudouridine synthase [Rubritalea sp.]|uniref:RluA family pseudouridine synthase n=1 Tax=Rubritalea sp. TaxID=2109375 RepID=UPI003242FAD2